MLGAEASNLQDSAEERAQRIFKKMDINHDGALTEQEFIKGCLNDDDLTKILTAG